VARRAVPRRARHDAERGPLGRFLVAFRVPEHPVQVRITAERDAAPGAVLAGTL